jgi:hypothetical protein
MTAKTEAEHAEAMLNQPMDEITRLAFWRLLGRTPYSGSTRVNLRQFYDTKTATLADVIAVLETLNEESRAGSVRYQQIEIEYQALSRDVAALRRVFGVASAIALTGAPDNG